MFRRLLNGEIIEEGDQVDGCNDGWRDEPNWKPAGNIGEPAPDPKFPAHRQYRRPIYCVECGDMTAEHSMLFCDLHNQRYSS